jgi:DNA-binding GntR family transcriptional regulator
VVEAILAQKLAPGERLGEQALAENFGVSRTMVREALMQLQARGFVEVQSRHEAVESCAEHAAIVAALEAGDTPHARQLMLDHIGNVEQALQVEAPPQPDADERLRSTLAPVALPRGIR